MSRFLPHRRTPHGREAGVALVEFALVLPLLLVILFGMLDFGKAFNYWIDTTHLANSGEPATEAAVKPTFRIALVIFKNKGPHRDARAVGAGARVFR